MREHRALGHAGGATGVLQTGDIAGLNRLIIGVHLDALGFAVGTTGGNRLWKAHMRHFDRLHRAVPVLLHQPDDAARQNWQKLRDAGDDHVGDRVALGGGGDLVGKHIHDDQRLRLSIGKLLGHLIGSVERVDVHQNAAGLEDAEGGHWKGEAIGHLQRHAVPLLEPGDFAQIDREGVRHLIDLGEGQGAVHAVGQACRESGLGSVGLSDRSDQVANRAV